MSKNNFTVEMSGGKGDDEEKRKGSQTQMIEEPFKPTGELLFRY